MLPPASDMHLAGAPAQVAPEAGAAPAAAVARGAVGFERFCAAAALPLAEEAAGSFRFGLRAAGLLLLLAWLFALLAAASRRIPAAWQP